MEQETAPTGEDVRQLATRSALIGAAVTAVMIGVLAAMGRVWWCTCGEVYLWSGEIWSQHNSQHLADPYVFTHMLHGLVFYGALRLAMGPARPVLMFAIAMVAEAAWEIAENTPMVINRYRESTISLDYFGDSIVNSTGDLWAMALGFWFTRAVDWKISVGVFIAVEVALLLTIRDSLLVNVIMLISPVDAIRDWQMAGAPASP